MRITKISVQYSLKTLGYQAKLVQKEASVSVFPDRDPDTMFDQLVSEMIEPSTQPLNKENTSVSNSLNE